MTREVRGERRGAERRRRRGKKMISERVWAVRILVKDQEETVAGREGVELLQRERRLGDS